MKIKIRIESLVLLLILLFRKNSTFIIFLFSIFLHEISHLIIGVIMGGKPRLMRIEPFGISLDFYEYGNSNHFLKLVFFLIGPITNLVFCMIILKTNFDENMKEKIFYTNLLLSVFNLIPIIPLDGGRALLEVLKIIFTEDMSNNIVLIASKTLLLLITFSYSILIIKVKSIYILFLILYLWYLYYAEKKKIMMYKKTKEAIYSEEVEKIKN